MKSEILTLLRQSEDYVSGQELCERFRVSRTAVWKAIGQLKKEGYRIEAVRNRGYRLIPEQKDIFGQNELDSRMNTKWVGKPTHFYETIGSTNIQAKAEAENGAGSGSLIVADNQTAGRGRRGRAWISPKGANIYFTLLLKPDFAPAQASMLTIVMAMAVLDGIIRSLERDGQTAEKRPETGIKWPNDIVMNGKKVCGILTEMSLEGEDIQSVVIGVGINVKRQEFAPEIADKATSIEGECGVGISRSALTADIMEAFEKYYEDFCRHGDLTELRDAYNERLVNAGRKVRVLDPKEEFDGIALGIDETGKLLVETEDQKIVKVYAGEVSVRGIYGYV